MELQSVSDCSMSGEAERALQQSRRLELVGRLAGSVAHDFNNLLSVIVALTSLCLNEADGNERLRGHLLQIQQADERAALLTRRLLAFSRGRSTELLVSVLDESITSMEWMLRCLADRAVELSIELSAGRSSVGVRPGELDQLLMNLVANARDALPGGGAIRVGTLIVKSSEVPGLDEADVLRRFARLSVADNGPGIPAHVLPRLFEPFFTTKPSGEGTGLGLATVRGIAEGAGGCVRVATSSLGTTFSVYLPVSDDPPTQPPSVEA